jgi:hypothetical protein
MEPLYKVDLLSKDILTRVRSDTRDKGVLYSEARRQRLAVEAHPIRPECRKARPLTIGPRTIDRERVQPAEESHENLSVARNPVGGRRGPGPDLTPRRLQRPPP